MTEQTKEVKDDEVVNVEPTDDEEIIEGKTEQPVEEKETPSEPSTEEKPSETTEGEEETGEKLVTHKPEEDKGFVEPSEEIEDEIKHLPGESPREYALRLEVTRLKRGNREKRAQELLGEEVPKKISGITESQYGELSEEEKTLLDQYDKSELDTFEKILNVLAKKYGWVKRGELAITTRNQISNDILDDFLKSHEEYLPENDKDDLLWNRFKEEFSLYKVPNNPKELKRIFNKIHTDIFGVLSDDELKTINAQKEKVKVASHSGSSASRGQSSTEETTLTPEEKQHFKGFSDKDFKELGL